MKWNRKINIISNTCFFSTLLLFLFGIYSCVDVHTRQQEKTFGQEVYENVIEKVEEDILTDEYMEKHVLTKWYRGHEYYILVRNTKQINPTPYGFVHSPNCPCINE